jgi:hypothetical protein
MSQGHRQVCFRCGKEGHIWVFCTETMIHGKGAEKAAMAAEERFAF